MKENNQEVFPSVNSPNSACSSTSLSSSSPCLIGDKEKASSVGHNLTNINSDNNDCNNDSNQCQIRCKYCRTLLFKEKDLVHFSSPFSSDNHQQKCSHFFSDERPLWMGSHMNYSNNNSIDDNKESDTESSSVSGKIYCPKCHHKLGQFSWIGIPCACGQWIVPAFALLKSRTDCLLSIHR